MINVEMKPVPPVGGPPLDVVQRESRPSRAAAEAGNARRQDMMRQNAMGIAYQVHEQRAELPEQLWEVTDGSESRILLLCH